MSTEYATHALWTLFALAGVLAIWQLGIKSWIDEAVRFELFKRRDALFDRAAEGAISFDDPDYRATRNLLNIHIRFFHKMDGMQIVAGLVMSRWEGAGTVWKLPEISNEYCLNAIRKSNRYIIGGALMKSPVIFLMVFLYAWFLRLKSNGDRGNLAGPLRRLLRRVSPFVDATPFVDEVGRAKT